MRKDAHKIMQKKQIQTSLQQGSSSPEYLK